MVDLTSNSISIAPISQLEPTSTTHRHRHRHSPSTTSYTPTSQSPSTPRLLSLYTLSPSSSDGNDSMTDHSSSSSFVLTLVPSTLNPSSVVAATPSNFVSTAFTTPSSPARTGPSTPTPPPSQSHGPWIPVIVVVCISTGFILTLAVVFIVWRSRRRHHVQLGEARSTTLGIVIPQISPTASEAPYEQLPPSSDNVNHSLPRSMTKRQHTQRNQPPSSNSRIRETNSPIGSLRRVMEQLSRREACIISPERSAEMGQQMAVLHEQMQQPRSGQFERLQKRLVHADGIQGLSDDEELPAYYVQS